MKAILAIGALALGITARADMISYKLDITRNGVTDTQLVYNMWAGEYPEPVIDVNNGLKGTTKIQGYTTIQGFTSLRNPTDKVSCTIKNGLYHPWSRQKNSTSQFLSIIEATTYVAVKNVKVQIFEESLDIPAGTRLENVIPTGEGFCSAKTPGFAGGSVDLFCGDFDVEENFKIVSKSREMFEQWIQLQCAEGHKVYVQDEDLLKQRGVKKGEITDWGSVDSVKKITKKNK